MFSIINIRIGILVLLMVGSLVKFVEKLSELEKPATQLWAGLVPCVVCKGSGRTENQETCKACVGKRMILVYVDASGNPVECPHCAELRKKEKAGYFNQKYNTGSPDFLSCCICGGIERFPVE